MSLTHVVEGLETVTVKEPATAAAAKETAAKETAAKETAAKETMCTCKSLIWPNDTTCRNSLIWQMQLTKGWTPSQLHLKDGTITYLAGSVVMMNVVLEPGDLVITKKKISTDLGVKSRYADIL